MAGESPEEASMRDRILDIAESGFRKSGYDGLSFRDIAASLGIKSASVHYHFARKEDLAVAVVQRYARAFLDALGDSSREMDSLAERRSRLAEYYLALYREEGSLCLCAVFGAAPDSLPETVRDAVRNFYAALAAWMRSALGAGTNPGRTIGLLQGAMLLSVATGEEEHLKAAANLAANRQAI